MVRRIGRSLEFEINLELETEPESAPMKPLPPSPVATENTLSLPHFCRIECEVSELLTLGPAPMGERRCVPLLGGTVRGALNGHIVPGGTDWQWNRTDGTLELDAHDMLQLTDGARVEVRSAGMRHGPPEVMARLARGEAVAPSEYVFRTAVRFVTGAPAWQALNNMLAIAVGQRQARLVLLDLYRAG
jgi:Protein of unknown function (DUF3237)